MSHRDTPEEVQEAERLEDDANEGTFQDNDGQNAADKADRPAKLVLAREEVERLCWADDERNTGQEEQLRACDVEGTSAPDGMGEKERRTLPSARSAPSKKSATPSMRNSPPNVVSATPISAAGACQSSPFASALSGRAHSARP
jgi:hypothetical protein